MIYRIDMQASSRSVDLSFVITMARLTRAGPQCSEVELFYIGVQLYVEKFFENLKNFKSTNCEIRVQLTHGGWD